MPIVTVAAVVAGSLALLLPGGGGSAPATTIVRNGDVWLQGEISDDSCAPSEAIPDAGCTITVNGYQVVIVQGNAIPFPTPGTVTGLDLSRNLAGHHADVYAQLTGPHWASILNAQKYYARISG